MTITIDLPPIPAAKAGSGIDRELAPLIARVARVRPEDVSDYRIVRKSIDAQKKPAVALLFRVDADLAEGARPTGGPNVKPYAPREMYRPFGGMTALRNPLVVGAGPAGLFAALVLAQAGCAPVVLERGRDVDRRRRDIEAFRASRMPDPESNYLYGEGGAGTWSDGKLFTRIHEPAVMYVLETFVECGADPSITYFSHPHLGSDRLPGIIAALRERIIRLGGTFRWDSRVDELLIRDGACRGVRLADGETLESDVTVVAAGHSARAFTRSLFGRVRSSMKGFQVGIRIEHPQEFINAAQYGMTVPPDSLGAAPYQVVSRPSQDGRIDGAASFCMCPGGEIIAAVTDADHLSTNGMSNAARDGKFAIAAALGRHGTCAVLHREVGIGPVRMVPCVAVVRIGHAQFHYLRAREVGVEMHALAPALEDFCFGDNSCIGQHRELHACGFRPRREHLRVEAYICIKGNGLAANFVYRKRQGMRADAALKHLRADLDGIAIDRLVLVRGLPAARHVGKRKFVKP